MEKYFDKIQKFNTNYSPERLQILDNRVEKEIGDLLYLKMLMQSMTIF